MAHLWTFDNATGWTALPLRGDAGSRAGATALLPLSRLDLRRVPSQPDTWVLLSADADAVCINGLRSPLGLTVLADRDELRLPGLAAWFSTESQAHIETLPESVTRGFCPRCKQGIPVASPAVRCPACGLWHHASDELPCWTYAPTCAGCTQDTALDAGFRWTPEDL